mmetsp:Transcript_8059/g.12851  ORF Transcript_8059/g.12851 Transcript_8059/m.12851 type:complete len:92 (+) Transcript_8059:118-393(+)
MLLLPQHSTCFYFFLMSSPHYFPLDDCMRCWPSFSCFLLMYQLGNRCSSSSREYYYYYYYYTLFEGKNDNNVFNMFIYIWQLHLFYVLPTS